MEREIGRGETADVHQRGGKNPNDSNDHDQALEEIHVRHSQVTAQKRVNNDDRERGQECPLVVEPGDEGHPFAAGDELGEHIEREQEHRQARGDEARGG